MQAFLLRSLILFALFFLGAFIASLGAQNYLAVAVWFIAVTAWTLILGFRAGLFIIIPFLLFADVLWDGRIGELFGVGFLLATATTYLAVRIETQSWTLQWAVYSILIAVFSALVVWVSLAWPHLWFTFPNVLLAGKVLVWQLLATSILYVPISTLIQRVETFLDTSYRKELQKIR